MIEYDKLRDIDYFVCGKFAMEIIYDVRASYFHCETGLFFEQKLVLVVMMTH